MIAEVWQKVKESQALSNLRRYFHITKFQTKQSFSYATPYYLKESDNRLIKKCVLFYLCEEK
jgi:hypothetical protein